MVEEETLKKAAIGLGTGVVSGVVAGPLVATVAVGSILAIMYQSAGASGASTATKCKFGGGGGGGEDKEEDDND
eukprot:02063.XXX_17721_17445_1 [CDS] Oithona nana genome sequencing.